MSKERTFNGLSRGSSELTGAEVGVGVGARTEVRASKTVLRICYKLSLEYLETLITMTRATAMREFVFVGLISYSKNFDLGSRKKSREATKKVTEGCSRQRQSWPQIKIILVQTSKILFQTS